jgi:hypothetical protein
MCIRDRVYGREARTSVDVYIDTESAPQHSRNQRRQIEASARNASKKTHQRNKERYDVTNRTADWRAYRPGDSVKLKDHSKPEVTGPGAGKFRKKWSGPFTVLEAKGTSFKINQRPQGKWINARNLAPWHQRSRHFEERASVRGGCTPTNLENKSRMFPTSIPNERLRSRPHAPKCPGIRGSRVPNDNLRVRTNTRISAPKQNISVTRNQTEAQHLEVVPGRRTRHCWSQSDVSVRSYGRGQPTQSTSKQNQRSQKYTRHGATM